MSEKRFSWKTEKLQHLDDEVIMVVDNANKEWKGHILNIVDKLNEQQATIEMYQRRVHKREEQISIIKKHCLKFLTDEQVETIRKELENG